MFCVKTLQHKGLDRERMMLNVKEQEAGQVKVPSIMD